MGIKVGLTVLIIALMTVMLFFAGQGHAEEGGAGQVPEGVYIKLTKDFYEHLIQQRQGSDKVYSNDPAQGHLREIAISARFVVETNLQILKQQETIIRLLQDILDKQK
jgi:hypothetical protein